MIPADSKPKLVVEYRVKLEARQVHRIWHHENVDLMGLERGDAVEPEGGSELQFDV
jgi:hypothetical protein